MGLGTSITSLPVRYPNIFHLHCVLKEPAAFALLPVEPIKGPAFVREHLLQIPDGKSFRGSGTGFIRKTPDRVHVVVLGERLEKLGLMARGGIDPPPRHNARTG